jgi:hypothetical protein
MVGGLPIFGNVMGLFLRAPAVSSMLKWFPRGMVAWSDAFDFVFTGDLMISKNKQKNGKWASGVIQKLRKL